MRSRSVWWAKPLWLFVWDSVVELSNTIDQAVYNTKLSLGSVIGAYLKIFLDLTIVSVLLLFSFPIFLVIVFLVKLDGGPAFFAHIRVGKNNSRFRCFKFRSIVINGDEILRDKLENDSEALAEWSKMRKLRNDPRVTKIGRFLRATSLDEIPQLINVLRLEMSLVGPRPIVEEELYHYGEHIATYYKTRPGITGLWQVSGRSDVSFRERVRLDVEYVRYWSFKNDVLILARTIPAVLARKGAC
jgi:Undecaprenyl-phosphate galactose phosphotransferase WbaP